jgi:transketolase
MNSSTIKTLQRRALELRIDSIRATTASGSGHPTSCLSAADLISVLFFNTMKFKIENPKDKNNDRFIMSKGHAIPVVYAAWKQLGIIGDKELMQLRKFDSPLEGHPTSRTPYNEAATGSLGQGLGIGVGMALNAKKEALSYKTFVMMGDGEVAEGSVWEAAELGSHYKLNNLIGIVDCNTLGQSGKALHPNSAEKYAKKFEAFGWNAKVVGGHDIEAILETINSVDESSDKPFMIIAKTNKGQGLPSLANKNGFHGKPFKKEEFDAVMEELRSNFGEKIELEASAPVKINIEKQEHQKISIDLSTDINSALFDEDIHIATRKAFGLAIATLGKENKNIFALDGDVQNSTHTDLFAKENPEQFIQCYIAEQAMVSVATGLESRGKIPFAATFGAFFTRAHDQIRMAGIGKNALRLSGSHCGVSIGEDGPSQMALEDIAMMRSIPESIVLYPSDGVATYKLVEQMANYHDGISYIRTTRASKQMLYNKNESFPIGGCKVLKKNRKDKACIVAAGITLHEALRAYEKLQEKGISVSVIDLYSIKPIDSKTIIATAKASNHTVITVEDHYLEGGLGEAVQTALSCTTTCIKSLAVEKISRSGKPEELMRDAKIDAEAIVEAIKKLI